MVLAEDSTCDHQGPPATSVEVREHASPEERLEDGAESSEDEEPIEDDDLLPQAMFSLDTPADVALDPDLLNDYEFGM